MTNARCSTRRCGSCRNYFRPLRVDGRRGCARQRPYVAPEPEDQLFAGDAVISAAGGRVMCYACSKCSAREAPRQERVLVIGAAMSAVVGGCWKASPSACGSSVSTRTPDPAARAAADALERSSSAWRCNGFRPAGERRILDHRCRGLADVMTTCTNCWRRCRDQKHGRRWRFR